MEKVLQSFWPPCISKLDYFKEFLWKLNNKWPRDFDQDLIRKWDRKIWHKMGVEASATIRTGWCPPGFVTHLFMLTSACGTEGSKGEGKRKEEIQKWKGRRGFTRWPLKWEHPAPIREVQSLFSRHQELRMVLGKRPAPAAPGFQQHQQQSSPDFKGNWIRPMSRAFQRLILKSFMLVTLPEGKQIGLCIHAGTGALS